MISIEDVMSQAAARAGLDTDQTRAALTGALGLLEKHAEVEARDAFYAAVPGAAALARSPEAKPRGGGLMGGLMKSAGGVSGAAIGDAMGLLDRLKKIGVGKDELKRLLPAARDAVREATGRDWMGEAVRTVPGVGALLGDG
jgi:predicted DsbA family dithiol-disulfide isomerase